MSLKLIKKLRLFNRDETGQSLVQLALVMPILMMLLSFVVDFARFYDSKLLVSSAAAECARTYGFVDSTNMREFVLENYKDRLDTSKVSIDFTGDDVIKTDTYTYKANDKSTPLPTNVKYKDVTVNVNYEFDFIMPLTSVIFGDTTVISQQYTYRVGVKEVEMPK